MRLFLDECLSPEIARALNAEGVHVAMHPRDFRALVATQAIHPGLMVLPCVGRARSEALLRAAIDFLSERGDPLDVTVNHVLEVSTNLAMQLYPLPKGER